MLTQNRKSYSEKNSTDILNELTMSRRKKSKPNEAVIASDFVDGIDIQESQKLDNEREYSDTVGNIYQEGRNIWYIQIDIDGTHFLKSGFVSKIQKDDAIYGLQVKHMHKNVDLKIPIKLQGNFGSSW